MIRWWTSLTLAVLCLGCPSLAWAQWPYPYPANDCGPLPRANPYPCGACALPTAETSPSCLPPKTKHKKGLFSKKDPEPEVFDTVYGPFAPGPLDPHGAPPGPPMDMGLPAGLPNAWDSRSAFMNENNCSEDELPSRPSQPKWKLFECDPYGKKDADTCYCWHGCYFYYGFNALQRQRLGESAIATINLTVVETDPVSPFELVANDLNEVDMGYKWAINRFTLGYSWCYCALEAHGYYVPTYQFHAVDTLPGRLDSFFFNPPAGFGGNAGLWTHADHISTIFSTSEGNLEGNLRLGPRGCEFIVGVRYFSIQERLSIFVDDDTISSFVMDRTLQAFYTVRTQNEIFGPQVGFECAHDCGCGFGVGMWAKGMWGVNQLESRVELVRGDGLIGFQTLRNRNKGGQVYDIGLFADLFIGEHTHLRFGWDFLMAVGVAEAVEQVDFNLANTLGRQSDDGSIFYQGPLFEMRFLY